MVKDLIILLAIAIVSISSIIFLVPMNTTSLIDSRWYITIAAFFAALIANATAIGGGMVFVPIFIYGFGLSSLSSVKLSLATQSFGMSSGALGWGRASIDRAAFIVGGSASLVGVCLGTYLWDVPSELVKPVFAYMSILIVLALVLEGFYGNYGTARSEIEYKGIDAKLVGLVVIGAIGGIITSWIAIGVGELIALYLLLVYRTRVETAIATGVAILAIDSILGFMLHIDLGGIPWDMLIFTIPGVVFGGYAGGKLGRSMDEYLLALLNERVRPTFHRISPLRWFIIIVIAIDTVIMMSL